MSNTNTDPNRTLATLTSNGGVHVLADSTGADLTILTAAALATYGTPRKAALAWCAAAGYRLA